MLFHLLISVKAEQANPLSKDISKSPINGSLPVLPSYIHAFAKV